jgi:hypothetical protein
MRAPASRAMSTLALVSHGLLPSMMQASSRPSAVHARSMADAPILLNLVGRSDEDGPRAGVPLISRVEGNHCALSARDPR